MTKWRSVNSELPDTCRRVLIAEPHGYMAIAQYVPIQKTFYECGQERKVKYWAELPEPPEAE